MRPVLKEEKRKKRGESKIRRLEEEERKGKKKKKETRIERSFDGQRACPKLDPQCSCKCRKHTSTALHWGDGECSGLV